MHIIFTSNFAGSYITKSFGEGIGPINMDFVACNGTENGLRMCNYFTHSYGCTHKNDVGIQCQPGLLVLLCGIIINFNSTCLHTFSLVLFHQHNAKMEMLDLWELI